MTVSINKSQKGKLLDGPKLTVDWSILSWDVFLSSEAKPASTSFLNIRIIKYKLRWKLIFSVIHFWPNYGQERLWIDKNFNAY